QAGANIRALHVTVVQTGAQPIVSFSADPNPATINESIAFSNSSTDAESYAWDFGDGVGTSAEANPSYTYTSPNTYTVTLTATGEGGTKSATKEEVQNDEEPVRLA